MALPVRLRRRDLGVGNPNAADDRHLDENPIAVSPAPALTPRTSSQTISQSNDGRRASLPIALSSILSAEEPLNFSSRIPTAAAEHVEAHPIDPSCTLAAGLLAQRKLRMDRMRDIEVVDIEWFVLLELYVATFSDRCLSLSDLYYVSGFARSTTLRSIDGLVERAYVSRVTDPHDARRKLVCLCPETRLMVRKMLTEMRADMVAALAN
jgi:DNA-binding MarR family transcriptional regulator